MYINTFKYSPQDVSCQLCTEYVKKVGCTALRCPWLAERIEAGVVGYREAISETFSYDRRLFYRFKLLNIVGRVVDVWHNGNRHGCKPPFYTVPCFNGVVWNCIDHGTNYHYDHVTGKLGSLYAWACIWPYEFALFQLLSDWNDPVRAAG